MKYLNKSMLAAAVAALSLTSLGAVAHPQEEPRTPSVVHHMDSLKLTAGQKAQIQKIEQQYNTRPSREEMQQNWKQWSEQRNALLKNKNFDESAARRLIEQQQQKHTQLQLQNLKKEHAIFQVLTPQQQQQWQQQQDKRMSKFMDKRDRDAQKAPR